MRKLRWSRWKYIFMAVETCIGYRLSTAYLWKMIIWECNQSMRAQILHDNFLSHRSPSRFHVLSSQPAVYSYYCPLWASYAYNHTIHGISIFSSDYLCCLFGCITLDVLNLTQWHLCVTSIHSQPHTASPKPCQTSIPIITLVYFCVLKTALFPSSHQAFCRHCKWWKAK